jgi:hypothetical protein
LSASNANTRREGGKKMTTHNDIMRMFEEYTRAELPETDEYEAFALSDAITFTEYLALRRE